MKLGMSSAAFYSRMETEDQARHLRDFPIDVCEIFLETHSEYNRDFGQLIKARLGDLSCVSAHPKGSQFEADIFGRSPRQVEDALRIFASVCDAGAAFGARYYIFHGPGNAKSAIPPEKANALQERFGRMRQLAAARGMEVLWENVSWCSIRTPEQVRTAKRMLPGVGFVLDVKQAYQAGISPFEMAQAMGESLRHVHVLDWNERGELCLPGQGEMDWTAFFRLLKGMDYDGAIILEPYDWHTRDEEAVRQSLVHLREAMGNAGIEPKEKACVTKRDSQAL